MRKLEKRAILCLALAAVLIIGLGFYTFKLARDGNKWVSYPANKHIYTNGYLSTGAIYDKNGVLLLQNNRSGVPQYNDDWGIRRATLHAIGDNVGNISTGANRAFAGKLVGYNFVSGIYSTNDTGRKLYLTIDANVCKAANEALDGRKGTVGVYNYKTGAIVCMVSSPNYDPTDPPKVDADDSSGIYMNKLLSARVVPGSIFKVITATAAIEKLNDLDQFSYHCTGSRQFGSAPTDKVTCTYAHGTVDFREAMAVSCNCSFAELSIRLGPGNLEEYTKKAGLMDSYSVDGIPTTPGTFEFPKSDVTLAWTGIGQHKDLVNPASMMVYMGAIAGGGKSADPRIIESIKFSNDWPAGFKIKTNTRELVSSDTAAKLDEMLHNNVVRTYGEGNFPGLDLCAKSGTAELGEGQQPHAWFAGYIRNKDYPYAFIVLVENGGWGSETAGSVANSVLQEVIKMKPSD